MDDCMFRVGLRALCIVSVTMGHTSLLFLTSVWLVALLFRQMALYMLAIVLGRFFEYQHLGKLCRLQCFQRVSRHFT
jgi:hypothetical protein